jgi:iron complex transport system ATP-binding protein
LCAGSPSSAACRYYGSGTGRLGYIAGGSTNVLYGCAFVSLPINRRPEAMILQVNNLHFRYNSRPVLGGLSFSVERGTILGILGVNGAGKSTLLKCINKILRPQNGCVLVEDHDLSTMSRTEIAKRMGYVPQRHAEDHLNVFDTVLLGRRPYIEWNATYRDLDIVEKVIRLMRLEPLAMRPVTQLSGGEIQKVVIARALAQEPDLLLLDEPTSNLDLKNQLEVMNLVRHVVSEHGLAAIISVHDLNLALRFADRLLLLKDGVVHTLSDKEGLSPEIIKEVYDVDVILSDMDGYPVVIPM